MKLATPLIEHVTEFREGAVYSLVIENQVCFRHLIADIASQIEGRSGEAVLSIDNTTVSFSKYAELLPYFIPFSLNRRTLLTKIVSALEKTGMDESHYLQTNTLLAELERYIGELAFMLPCDIQCGKMTLDSILKAAGVSIEEEADDLLERVLTYMELVHEFEHDKLYILVNMRSYVTDEQMNAFAETAIGKKFRVLLIETCDRSPFHGEVRWVVDRDWCEI